MKKFWLCGLVMSLYLQGCGQPVTPLGTKGRPTSMIGTQVRLNYLIPSYSSGKFLTIDPSTGNMVFAIPASSGSAPIATLGTNGIVRPDGTTLQVAGDGTLSVLPNGIVQPLITAGSAGQYYAWDKTFKNLVLSAITNFPSVSGQAGKILTNDGTNVTWGALSGGSGLASAYTGFTDGSNTTSASGATTFKYRSANNLAALLVTANDITHGDNLLVTINQGNFVLTESQITGLVGHLSAKEPAFSSGTTLQYYRGDKSWQTLNTSVVPEAGGIVYFNNARVEAYAVNVYSKLTHNHNLSSLGDVNISGLTIGQHLKWNGSAWVPEDEPAGGSAPTINVTGSEISGSYTSPNLPLVITTGSIANSKLANMNNATIKGRITSGAGVPEDIGMTALKSSSMLDIANFPIQTLQVAVNSAQATTNSNQTATNALKLNITDGSPLGVLDASGASNVKLPRKTDAVLQRDTISLATFGGGSGILNDTAWVTTSTLLGSLFNAGTDSLIITNLNFILQGTSPTLTITLFYGTIFNSGGTAVVTGGNTVTNITTGTNITSFNNAKVPPNNYLWAKITAQVDGSKPIYAQLTVSGTKVRKG